MSVDRMRMSPASAVPTVASDPAPPAKMSLEGVTKTFRAQRGAVEALAPLDLRVSEGEFVAIVGPSGCGKTTLLNLIAGFDRPTAGRVVVDGETVEGPGPRRMVIFQEHALFPWLTAVQNVAFGLRQQSRHSARERRDRARAYLDLMDLLPFEHALVHELSGGMKQRVALARALAPQPRVLLMDEPFAALDALTREQLYVALQHILRRAPKTVLLVTHNVGEAACLADRVLVMAGRPGRITKQIAVDLPRPRDFHDPAVARIAHEVLEELRRNEHDKEISNGVAPHESRSLRDDLDRFLADGI